MSLPASRVVMATISWSTAKCTSVTAWKIRSAGLRWERYCAIASSTFCPAVCVFSSAVAPGIPLTARSRSTESAGLDSE